MQEFIKKSGINWAHVLAVPGGLLVSASGGIAAKFDWDFPIYGGVTSSAVAFVLGLFVAFGPILQKLLAWVYVLIIAARSGQQVQKLPDGLGEVVEAVKETGVFENKDEQAEKPSIEGQPK